MKYVFEKKEVFGVRMKDRDQTAYIWLDKLSGAQNFSIGSSDVDADNATRMHSHESEQEIMFVYKGKGLAVIEDKSYPLEPETLVFVPPKVEHQLKNTGPEKLSFVFFYVPGGPEQYLRKIQ